MSESRKTVKSQSTYEVVDTRTGERVYKEENKTYTFSAEPPFIKLYLQDILYLSDLPKAHDKVLLALLQKATWASTEYGMIVVLSAGMKRLMCERLQLKNIRSINNILSDFVKTDILKRIETGVYQLNPYLFGRGDWKDIEKLRMEVAYTFGGGRTFQSVIDYKTQKGGDDSKKQETPPVEEDATVTYTETPVKIKGKEYQQGSFAGMEDVAV